MSLQARIADEQRRLWPPLPGSPSHGHDQDHCLGHAPQSAIPTTYLWVRSPSWQATGAATGSANPAAGPLGWIAPVRIFRDGARRAPKHCIDLGPMRSWYCLGP